ncbi:MAG: peptidylprolyl isomerase [Coriobacteriia bacterium]|nr:peptidylprolyl isomerase [Coriobacteriia bacterium]
MSNEGKNVKVHYTGTLDSGEKFDSSYDRNEPLAFKCMAGQMIPGFDKAVKDMAVGDTVTVRLAPEDAYGPVNPDAIQSVPIANMPGAERLSVGQKVTLSDQFGRPFPAKVVGKEDGNITFDMNHELAGQHLTFEITLLEAN